MPTLRELQGQGGFRTQAVSPTGVQAATVQPVQTQTDKRVDLMAKDVEKLLSGAAKTTQAVLETSEYADNVRAVDTYSNFVKGMHEIDNHYQGKLDNGQALTVQDYKDKKDWQEAFLNDMTINGIQEGDDTNLIFKEKFLTPASEYSNKVSANDTKNQFAQHQNDVINKAVKTANDMSKDMTSDIFNQSISDLEISGNNNAIPVESKATATSYNTSFKSAEASGANYATVKEIVENEYPNVLAYDKDGKIVRGEGFNKLTDSSVKSMLNAIQAGHKRMVAAKKTKVIIDASNMKNNITDMNTTMDNGGSLNELLPKYNNSVIELDQEGYFNSTGTITAKGVVDKKIQKYRDDRTKINSYLSSNGVILDTDHLLNTMNADDTTSTSRYIAVVNNSNTSISDKASSVEFNFEDRATLTKQRFQIASMIDGMTKNSDFTGDDTGMIEMFKSIDKVGVKGKDALNVNSMYAYAIYKEQQNKRLGVVDTVSKSIYQALENNNLSESDKIKAGGIAISADVIGNNTAKANPFRKAETKKVIDDLYEGYFTVDANIPESTNSVVNSISVTKYPTAELQKNWLDNKAKVNVKFDFLPFMDKTLALLVPDGVPDGESKMKSFLSAMVIHENDKRANKIGKGDISFKAKEINGDLGYTAYIKSGNGFVQYEISKATLNHTDFLDENLEDRANASIGKPVSDVEKAQAARQKSESLSLTDLLTT